MVPGKKAGQPLPIFLSVIITQQEAPVTFYKSVNDLPDFSSYDMEGRTYRYFKGEALYPFGFGLGYTAFSYSNLQLPENASTSDKIRVSVDVENMANDGDELFSCM